MSESAPTAADTRRLAEEARARVRFEEEALGLSGPCELYGRRNVLLTLQNEIIADIVEILPP